MSRWPVELTFRRASRVLAIRWDDGSEDALPFETLRVESPSAEVQGHGAHDKKIVTGKQDVGVVRAEPVGRYAVRIVFDDGHDTGLFTWDWLARLAGRAA
jgi:DUF971 family protein